MTRRLRTPDRNQLLKTTEHLPLYSLKCSLSVPLAKLPESPQLHYTETTIWRKHDLLEEGVKDSGP